MSLSPASIASGAWSPRLVLPSPNGSTIVAQIAESGAEVIIGCLRNATAVAVILADRLRAGRTIGVVSAGERWEADDSLRPALEDQIGAGAILSAVVDRLPEVDLSPEAHAGVAVFNAMGVDLLQTLHDTVGGQELALRGFSDDVDVAAALDASTTVPVLRDGRLIAG